MCHPTRITHFSIEIGGYTVIVDLCHPHGYNIKTVKSFIGGLRLGFEGVQIKEIETIENAIRVMYPKCTFINELPKITTAYSL